MEEHKSALISRKRQSEVQPYVHRVPSSVDRQGATHKNAPLLRALGVRRGAHILDTTAGLGSDAFVIADAGYHVTLVERHPVLFALLEEPLSPSVTKSCSAKTEAKQPLACFK